MVKPDLKHNYYQDLDLPITASVDDVRKAYRKLALQFHPDRNAGREEECVPRFQAIQAANEILSDPTLKAKYDADRRKVGLYPSFTRNNAPGSTGSPYAARSDFPPPPRRTQPGTWQRPGGQTAHGPQPTGAERFTNFPRPAGAAPQKNPAADRTQQFRAWQNMKEPSTAHRPQPPEVPPRQQAPPRSPQPPTPGAAPTSARPQASRRNTNLEERIRAGMRHGTTAGPSAEEAASRQSAWQSFQNSNAGQPGMNSNGQRRRPPATPKRPGGFDPNAPGSDERPAPQSSHYVHRHKSDDFGGDGFPPPPPGPPPGSAPHSPTSPDTQRPSRSRAFNDDAPYAEANRTSTPYSSYIGEKTAFNASGLARSASVRDTTKLSPESANSSSSTRARSVDPATRRTQASSGSPTHPPYANENAARMRSASTSTSTSEESSDDNDDGDDDDDDDVDDVPEQRPTSGPPSRTSSNTAQPGGPAGRNIKTPKPPSRFFPNRNGATNKYPLPDNDGSAHTDGEQATKQERKKSENIFSFPIDPETFKQTKGKSRSVEEINTTFSPGGFHGKFEGSGDYFANGDARRPSPAHRQSSRRSQRTATTDSTSTSNGTSPMPRAPQPATGDTSQPGPNAPFSPEAWQKTFSDGGAFAWPPPPPGPPGFKAPSRKSSRATRANGKGPTSGSAQQPHVIDDDVVIGVDSTGRPMNSSAFPDDGDAMDIDTPPPAERAAPAEEGTPLAKEARLYSVPPSEWRQQQASQPQQLRHTSGSARRAERKSAGESSLNVNLDDLRHTEPFARSNDGLKGMGDLTSSLPFTSKASSVLQTQMPRPVSYLQQSVPLPKAPEGPTKLTRTSWDAYYQKFANYLVAFHSWNKAYLQYFESCEQEAETRIKSGSGWLVQSGDTVNGTKGFASYLRSARDENQTRVVYGLGRDKHLEAVESFDKIRERVRALTESGTLADV
ncbi:uncharacterized protein SEPMUDRAFT_148167 [Sphaerulina musiva SO2202]|uniref:J domain-containing protein n=1 Tax=Sphaerulina musiva (strain SO2202) TaxID=692275 RepID=M3C2I7_SPHMS|nr:uncharacterized protein SEPMUDRAFT_148167 [Sphaerulina musiva SO2202]EMF14466.1 hypothetical protein SEPMUDRAFT_148167 [Sphaerulina musiva SO2202]